MKKCNYCGRGIEEKAAFCGFCGERIVLSDEIDNSRKEQGKSRLVIKLVLAFSLLLIVVGVVGYLF